MRVRLADLFPPRTAEPVVGEVLNAVVEAINGDGTAELTYLGGLMSAVPVIASYAAVTGDVVKVQKVGAGSWLVLGPVAALPPAGAQKITAALSLSWNLAGPSGTVDTVDNPGGLADPYIVSATATASYRGSGWRTDNTHVYQGAYSGANYGYHTGCWFYGTKPQALKGRAITGFKLRLRRQNSSHGSSEAEYAYVYPHVHEVRPSGAPILRTGDVYGVTGPVRVGPLTRGQAGIYPLPPRWGQALVDGHVKGLGLRRDNFEDYAIFDSLAAYAQSGLLEFDWT